jgi:hypothetical protein
MHIGRLAGEGESEADTVRLHRVQHGQGPRMGLGINLHSAKGPLHKQDTSSTLGSNE